MDGAETAPGELTLGVVLVSYLEVLWRLRSLKSRFASAAREHAFFINGMHPSERRLMCVRISSKHRRDRKGSASDLAEVDDDDAPMPTENSVLQSFVMLHAYTLRMVLRCAFDPRECPKCGSRKHPLTTAVCEQQWAAISEHSGGRHDPDVVGRRRRRLPDRRSGLYVARRAARRAERRKHARTAFVWESDAAE